MFIFNFLVFFWCFLVFFHWFFIVLWVISGVSIGIYKEFGAVLLELLIKKYEKIGILKLVWCLVSSGIDGINEKIRIKHEKINKNNEKIRINNDKISIIIMMMVLINL